VHGSSHSERLEKVYFGHGEVATGPISRALGWA
jgi:ABC-type transport system substrate-binding protein